MNKNELNLNIKISEGNFVLKSTEELGFMVFDLPAKITCPYATNWCKKYCYANDSQDIFNSVLNSRMRNFEESKKDTFVKDMINIIEFNLERKKYKNKEKVYFRFHSSGDIYNTDYLNKIIEIVNHFKANSKIKFQAYTKSLSLLENYDLSKINIKILFSVVEDTSKEQINKAKNMGLSCFVAVYSTDNKEGYICKGDCSSCQVCYENNKCNNIYVQTHGGRVPKKPETHSGAKIKGKFKNYRDERKTVS
jgi:hypothetical protein